MALARVFPSVGPYHCFLHTSITGSYFSLSFATTAEKDRKTFFFVVLGAYPITHPTYSLFLLSREQGMEFCSCHMSSHTFSVLVEKGKSVLQDGAWGYVPHDKNLPICLQLKFKAEEVRSKYGIDCSYFLWQLENLECLPKNYGFY